VNSPVGSDPQSGSAGSDVGCDPDAGNCDPAGATDAAAAQPNGVPTNTAATFSDGFEVGLMVLAGALLLALGLAPPLIAQGTANRRSRRDQLGGEP
jgi:hypothetical protein